MCGIGSGSGWAVGILLFDRGLGAGQGMSPNIHSPSVVCQGWGGTVEREKIDRDYFFATTNRLYRGVLSREKLVPVYFLPLDRV